VIPLRLNTLSRLLILTLQLMACGSAVAAPNAARQLIQEALTQMGGEAKIRSLKSLRFEALGYRNLLEQSERPEGPYIVEFQRVSVMRDLEHLRQKQTNEATVANFPSYKMSIVVADEVAAQSFGDRTGPGSRDQLETAREDLELGPERVLLTAIAAPDLRVETDTVLQAVPHHVVAFTWRNIPVRVFLNANTALPTKVEWKCARPYGSFWSVWGDVTTRVYYSLWWLTPEGVHYPLQWDVFRNDLPDVSVAISRLELNPELPADTFAITQDVKDAFAKRRDLTADNRPLGFPGQPGTEIAKDIVFIPGSWNTTLVRQGDGIVILEAPISSGYSAKAIAEAERRWPGVPIKAAVSTSDAWPHIGGVREYVARGIPIYAPDLNLPILTRVVSAPRSSLPDALARNPRPPVFRPVSGKMMIGDGPNRMEIYPLRGETTERQMMIYFPEHKLLYGSDAFQKEDANKYFYAQTVWEVVHAVERESLNVDTFFMMHMGPTPWREVKAVLAPPEKTPSAK